MSSPSYLRPPVGGCRDQPRRKREDSQVLRNRNVAFWRVDRLAGLLCVPYLLWVVFATALNVAILAAA